VQENFIQRKTPVADSGITSSMNSHNDMVVNQKRTDSTEYAPAFVERKEKNDHIAKWTEI